MIYLCQTCCMRINERCHMKEHINDISEFKNISQENIGKYLLYNHKPFCSTECINQAKEYPQILNREIIPYDWNEQGYFNKDRPNAIET